MSYKESALLPCKIAYIGLPSNFIIFATEEVT